MSVFSSRLHGWMPPRFRKRLLETRDLILEGDDLHRHWGDILVLSFLLFSSSHNHVALDVLRGYFKLCPVQQDGSKLVWTLNGRPVFDANMLHLMLHYTSRPLSDFPPVPFTYVDLQDSKFDTEHPAFFQLDNWTNTEWIPKTDYVQRESYTPIDATYDVHQWKQSDDPWTHAICARLLCRVPEGQLADRIAVEEAFEAVDKLFTQLPRRKDPNNAASDWPHADIFPMKIYFLLAINLGKHKKARWIIQLSTTPPEYGIHKLVGIPAAYEIMLKSTTDQAGTTFLFGDQDAESVKSTLLPALAMRFEHGQQEPLPGVEWPELLTRWSEVAFKTRSDDFEKSDNPPSQPSDLLLPPTDAATIEEVERTLGPLPQDIKDMVLVANGFRGGWHFAGGGFAGIKELNCEPASEHEIYLGYMPTAKEFTEIITNPTGTIRTVTKKVTSIGLGSSGNDWGPVYVSPGAIDNDDFIHVICPPATWKRMNGDGAKNEEYRVLYYSHWTGGANNQYRSMRHWIASMTASMERELACREGVQEAEAS